MKSFCDAYALIGGEHDLFPLLSLDPTGLQNHGQCFWSKAKVEWDAFLATSLSSTNEEVATEMRHLCDVAMCRKEKLAQSPPWAMLFAYLIGARLQDFNEPFASFSLPTEIGKMRPLKAAAATCCRSQLPAQWLQTRLRELGIYYSNALRTFELTEFTKCLF